jgi:hypothetical protein
MNERMLELAKQAGLKKDHASDREYIGDFDWRLFGDLIVRECADTAYQSLYEDRVFDDVPANIRCNVMDSIKQRFGVE